MSQQPSSAPDVARDGVRPESEYFPQSGPASLPTRAPVAPRDDVRVATTAPTVALLAVDRRALVRALVVVAAALAGIDTAFHVLRFSFGHDWVYGLAPLFDLDGEGNVPAWYSTLLLALAGLLLAHIATRAAAAGSSAVPWAVLAGGFLLMSFDEMIGLHALLPRIGADQFPAWTRVLWVPAGALIVGAVGVGFSGFLRTLPRETRHAFLLAGAVYVGGALGMEVLGGALLLQRGLGYAYATASTIEEAMEMLGVTMFVSALLAYVGSGVPGRAPAR